jgi:ABC-type bacteriocin/lantibiotic exporter with double-glycine peptidase domain
LYQPQSGVVCINELPIHNYNIAQLYKVIGNGLVEETIFEGTVLENITLGRDFVPIENVLWAIEKVYLSPFIKELPKGLDSVIDMEDRLSKSIVQRIIIARSIVNKPKLILLENQIDFIEEVDRNKIIDFLTDKSNGWTLIGISNNKYLQQKSDTVIIMYDGQIL